jgi:hypothetical protein
MYDRINFGTEPVLLGHHGTAFGADRFGLGVIIPSQGVKSVASVPPPPPPSSGDGDGGSATVGVEANDYGAGDQGENFDNTLDSSSGGLDPFAVAAFGFEGAFGVDPPPGDLPGAIDLLAQNEGEDMTFQPVGPDPYDVPEQSPTLRNPVMQFGFESEWFSGFGPAAVFGDEGVAVGCDLDQSDLLGCD